MNRKRGKALPVTLPQRRKLRYTAWRCKTAGTHIAGRQGPFGPDSAEASRHSSQSMNPGDPSVPPRDAVPDGARPPSVQRAPSALLSATAVSVTRGLLLILTLASGVLSAAYFGAGTAKDCYVVAMAVPTLLGTLLLSGVYGIVLVSLVDIGPSGGLAGQTRAVRRVIGQLAVVLVPLCLVASLFPRPIIRFIAPGFGPDAIELAGRLLPLTMFSVIGTVGFAVFRALFNARHRFAVPGFVNLILGVVPIIVLVTLVDRVGVFALAVGHLLGSLLSMTVLGALAFALLREEPGWVAPAQVPVPSAGGRSSWKDFLPLTLGANFGQVNLLVNNAFASHLAAGSITQLGFATVIFTNAEMLTIFALAEVAFQRFTVADRKGPRALEEELHLNLRYMMLLAAPITAGCLTFGAPVARLLFERGEFGPDATAGVAAILGCLGPEIIFMGFFACFWRILFARRRLWLLVWTSLAAVLLNGALNAILVERIGILGIALTTTSVTAVFAIALGMLVRREGLRLFGPGDRLMATRAIGAAAVMGVALRVFVAVFEHLVGHEALWARLAEVGAGVVLAAGVYAAALHLQGVRAIPEFVGRLAEAAGWRKPA